MKVGVYLSAPDSSPRHVTVPATDVPTWTMDDARQFVWAVWRLLKPTYCESLKVREVEPGVMFRLEFVADSGTATTGPLRLYSEALTWLQEASFDLSVAVTRH